MEIVVAKRCTCCGEVKPLHMYDRNEAAKDGYRGRCKLCRSARAKVRYAARKAEGRGRRRTRAPSEPLWPLPTYSLADSLGCIQLRKWRGPVSPPSEFRSLGARL